MNSNPADHYTYRVMWSSEDQAWFGLVAEWPSLSWFDEDSPQGAFEGIVRITHEAVTDWQERNQAVPEPIVDRHYSGKISLRIPPETHRRLTIEAAEQGISLNRLLSDRVAA